MEVTRIYSLLLISSFISVILCETHLLVDDLRLDFFDFEEKIWKYVRNEATANNQDDLQFFIIKQFNGFDQKLKKMPENVLRGLEPIRKIEAFLFLYSELISTQNLYEKFRQFLDDSLKRKSNNYYDKKVSTDKIQMDDIVRDVLDPKTGINVTVQNVFNLTFGQENMLLEIFELLIKDFNCKDFLQSPELIFYNLYNSIALNGLKSYIMLHFAYLVRQFEDKGKFTREARITKINFKKRVNETMSVFRGAMEIAPESIWRCDPKEHKKGETYVEITRLLQGHVENEVDMNTGGTCRENCALYTLTANHGCYDSKSKYCQEMERCSGKILDCRFIESNMDICVSKNPTRRYDYIQYKSGLTMGEKTQCWKKPVKSWWRLFVHCSYCMCLCDEQGPKSDRYINMRPVLSDTKNNRVITGLRFVKHNRIVHLQIQEGQLLPYGYVDNATVHWVPVDDYKITDPGVFSGEDYFTLSYENRSMALDDLFDVDLMYAMTGVRFIFNNNLLRLQITVTPFDWKNGSLNEMEYKIMFPASEAKNHIDLSNADIPTKSTTEINHSGDLYVTFTHTSFDLDAAQTTIPFIDAQPVYNNPPVPLRGAGLLYRGKKGFGGFIAPKIMTFDYSSLISEQFTEMVVERKNGAPKAKYFNVD